jgi:putative methionine-R-sulfoxide reductase with GAF domain
MPGLDADGHAAHAGGDDVNSNLGRAADRRAVRQVIAAAALENPAVRTADGQPGEDQNTLGSLVDAVLSDPGRVAALHRTGLLDGPPQLALDQFAVLTAEALGTPYAAVSLVDQDKHVVVGFNNSGEGLERTSPLDQSICKYAVASGEPLIVDDALEHPLLADSAVVRDGSVRSYAGIPLTDLRGHTVGTLCAWDGQPHHWTGSQIQILEDLAAAMRAKIFTE